MIERLRIQNYKALRDVTLDLTPMHVLIGPNDSGKTSILEAMAALCRSVDRPLPEAFEGPWTGSDLVWGRNSNLVVGLETTVLDIFGLFEYGLGARFSPGQHNATAVEEWMRDGLDPYAVEGNPQIDASTMVSKVAGGLTGHAWYQRGLRVHDALGGVHYYRWNPRVLSLPAAPDSSQRFRMERSGFGLARCLDDILGYDRDAFGRLESRFQSIFPQVRSIRLVAEPAYSLSSDHRVAVPLLRDGEGKGVHFEMRGVKNTVPAAQASDGVLLVLAYLTILHLPEDERPHMLLIEEPENGIHPERLEAVLTILRDLIGEQSQTQVILTTHSPYALDHFSATEVTVCQKGADGAVSVRRLSDSAVVGRLSDVFSLGEIWTSEGDAALAAPAHAAAEPDSAAGTAVLGDDRPTGGA